MNIRFFSSFSDAGLKNVFEEYFPMKKYSGVFEDIAKQAYALNRLEISDQMPYSEYRNILKSVPAIWTLLHEKGMDSDEGMFAAGIEFILEGLTVNQKLWQRLGEISSFKSVDVY